ncbi:MAG TPA: ABC transporter permease subunit [Ktedonobacteraceae bacterium]|nr:ABC transporter permease subunit [Ktedonobacteraceae bacterium]
MQTGSSNIAGRAIADEYTRPKGKDRSRRGGFGLDRVAVIVVMLYLLIPLGATLVFGLGGGGGISTFQRIFSDADFSQTLLTSLELAIGTTLLAIVLVTPTAYWVQLRLPRARPLLDFLTLIPFAVPAIVLSVGFLEEFSGTSGPLINTLSLGLVPFMSNTLNIINTGPLLVCAYVIIALPFVYRPIDNSLRAINTTVLTEAAYSLGSGWWRAFLTIILPNIWPGVISAALLVFSTVMGEFTIASLFNIYTFPIYLNDTGQNDPYKAALLSFLSFILTLLCVLGIILLVRGRRGGSAQQGSQVDIAGAR